MRPKTLDHVALWVADRDPIADFVTRHLGMHVIDRSEKFTLVGSNARRGKLTLFVAESPRERGALERVALRVNDLRAALHTMVAIFATSATVKPSIVGIKATLEAGYRSTFRVEQEVVYVVQTDQGQEVFSPEEFEKKYGWKNDPEKVRLLP